MANINKLKGKIIEAGFTVETFSKKVNMNKATFYRKINNDCKTFTIKEATNIVEVLGLSAGEAIEIFFNDIVA